MRVLSEYFKKLEQVGTGNLQPVYFLYGSDFYLKTTFIQEIKNVMVKQGIDRQYVTAKELRVSDLQQLLYGISLLQSRNFILIEEIKQMIPTVRKAFLKYLENPLETNILILTASVIEKRHEFLSKVSQSATTIYVNPPPDNEIPQWVERYVKKMKRHIEQDAIYTLIQMTGNDLNDLSNELEKLDLMLPEEDPITTESIMKSAGYQRTWTPEDLAESLGEKKREKAVTIAKNLINHGVSEAFINITLFHYLWNLRIIRDPRVEKGQQLTRTWRRDKYEKLLKASKQYSNADLARGIEAVLHADEDLKTTRGDSLTRLLLTVDKILG